LAVTEAEVPSGTATLHLWLRGGNAHSETLVLINGGPGLSHESMDPLQAALASSTLRVVTYDQRGVGRSLATGTSPFRPGDYLDDLDAIRRYLNQDKLHLLGHSFGGMVSLSYLDQHPDRVASLILASTGASDPEAMRQGGEALGRRIATLQREGLIPVTVPSTCRERFIALLPAYWGEPRRSAPDEMLRRKCDESGRSDVLSAFVETPYRHGVPTSRIPVLVLFGDLEPFGPGPSRAAAAALKQAQITLAPLPQCGHLGWLECKSAFLEHVEPFLQRVTKVAQR
jgi:pimeloyl-ACP methyl ester carboxylesterase